MSELSDQDLADIQEVHDRWIRAELSGEFSRLIELSTDDVRWFPPTAPPVVGKEGIAEYLSGSSVVVQDIKVSDIVIRGSGSIAYLTSSYHTRFVPEGGSEVQEATGIHLWILRKTWNGSWRVAIVTWSSVA